MMCYYGHKIEACNDKSSFEKKTSQKNDTQFIYDVVGKMPEYIPPVAAASSLSHVVEKKDSTYKKPKRNIIRDNINATKIKKPRISPRKDIQ